MNSDIDFKVQEYKVCAGRNCNNIARYFLTIVLIKQSGWFCSQCKNSLQEDGLIEYVIDEHIEEKTGESNLDKF